MSEIEMTGVYTGVDLSDLSPLSRPMEPDRFGRLMPCLSTGLLQLSAEMAADTYTLSFDRWLAAGWQDLAIQVENSLSCALESESASQRLAALRMQVNRRDPFNEAVGSIRQLHTTDTGKAAVLTHPMADGRYVIAISFMGTVARLYDWFANFRMASEDGFHQGFLALARQFAANEAAIELPRTAEALGMPRLTLADVLAEAARPDSRFVIWLSGHSQGGAVMQVYAHMKLAAGLLPQHLIGVGFAAPSVARPGAVAEPAAYPLWLVMNSDDVVPRFGAVTHLGECLIYPAGQRLRKSCYNWPRDAKAVHDRMLMRPFFALMSSTDGGMVAGSALLMALAGATPDEFVPAMRMLSPGIAVLHSAEPRPDSLTGYIIRRADAAHMSIYGSGISREAVEQARSLFEDAAREIGIPAAMAALAQMALNAHTMYARGDQPDGVYVWISRNGCATLLPAFWTGGDKPRLVQAERMAHVHGSRLQPPLVNGPRPAAPVRRSRLLPGRQGRRR